MKNPFVLYVTCTVHVLFANTHFSGVVHAQETIASGTREKVLDEDCLL